MKVIDSKSVGINKSILIFGAGKIGRSFIGQLFGRGGYEVVFVDVDQKLIEEITRRRSYKIIIKEAVEEEIIIENVRAVSGFDSEEVIQEICHAGIMAVSVGKNTLTKIIPIIARGLMARFSTPSTTMPIDIILAENMRSAGDFMRQELQKFLPSDFPVESRIGFVETSIGKMVPIMTAADTRVDPLMIYAEAYNELILDKKGFINPIPEVEGLAPKDNIKAWVDRKAFIHNLGHATTAYFGYYRHPEQLYLHEVLRDEEVLVFTKSVMNQAAEILLKLYPEDFTRQDLQHHINDLLRRFMNRALGDTLFRVGHDLRRKLGADDRFTGVIDLAKKAGMPYDKILQALGYGFHFRAKDENGQLFADDLAFHREVTHDPHKVLLEVCELKDPDDWHIVMDILEKAGRLQKE
jgi:mannitol-1-phosphate 5-dehydrogenase